MKVKVSINVCGIHVRDTEWEVAPDSIIGNLMSGRIHDGLQGVRAMTDELNAIPGVQAKAEVEEADD